MAEDDKKKIASSLPPPPTDDIDEEWGSSGTASPGPGKGGATSRSEADVAKAKAKSASDAKRRPIRDADIDERDDDEEDDEDEDDEDEDDDDDLDEDDDEDEDDDDDDDEDERRDTRSRNRQAAVGTRSSSQDWLPDWAPWATLGALLLFGFLGGLGIIPLNFNVNRTAVASPPQPAAPPPSAATPARPLQKDPARPSAADEQKIAAAHLLVSYKGALRAQPTVTRTKEEAKKRAQEALARAKKGEAFEKLVAEYSDEPRAAERGGKLGKFGRRNMVKEFSEAAFALEVGGLSDVVETQFGFHVIRRSE